MRARTSIVLGAALLIGGCSAENPMRPVPLSLISPAVLTQVRLAPGSVTAAGTGLRLSAELWRDFMPVSPPDGRPLAAALLIATVDSSEFPAELSADAAWVLNGDDVWATWLSETDKRPPGSPTLQLDAYGGPKWDPGIEVDVVVRLRDEAGATWYLGVKGVTIQRTD